MGKYLTKYLISVYGISNCQITKQMEEGITLHGTCIITLTKAHTLNDNFTVACVKYYTSTSIFLFKISESISFTAHFIVINHRKEIRAGSRSRVTIPGAFHRKKSYLLDGKMWINL